MNWAYVAGFFDGEGSIGLGVNKRFVRLTFAQSRTRGLLLLQEIQVFLASHGIVSHVHETHFPRLGKQRMYQLRINGVEGAKLFLDATLPYLRIKRTEAQDAIRFRTMYPPNGTRSMAQKESWARRRANVAS